MGSGSAACGVVNCLVMVDLKDGTMVHHVRDESLVVKLNDELRLKFGANQLDIT